MTVKCVPLLLVICRCQERWLFSDFFLSCPIFNIFLSLQHNPVIKYKDAHRSETRLSVGLLARTVVFSVVRKKCTEAKAEHWSGDHISLGCGDLDLR